MSIAKILVPVCGEDCDAAAIEAAIAAARPFGSHIELFAIHEDPALAVPMVGVPMAGDTIGAIIEGQTEHGNAAAARARAAMKEICARENVRIVSTPERGGAPTCALRQGWGPVADAIGEAAALSDLVVLGPMGWNRPGAFNQAFLGVLRDVRKPLLVAHAAARTPRRIVLGWDGGLAAARALGAALPFLEKAGQATLVTVGRPAGIAAEAAADYLALHGVTARIDAAAPGPAGPALLAAARDADLLVMGGYGHSHLLESVVGGVTAHVLAHATLPVLLAH